MSKNRQISWRDRRRNGRVGKKKQEVIRCPCVPKAGALGHMQGVESYYAVQKKYDNDATIGEFIEHCQSLSPHKDEECSCQLFWSYMQDYETGWISDDPHERLHPGGEFRIPGLNWEQVRYGDMETVARWIYYSLSQGRKRVRARAGK